MRMSVWLLCLLTSIMVCGSLFAVTKKAAMSNAAKKTQVSNMTKKMVITQEKVKQTAEKKLTEAAVYQAAQRAATGVEIKKDELLGIVDRFAPWAQYGDSSRIDYFRCSLAYNNGTLDDEEKAVINNTLSQIVDNLEKGKKELAQEQQLLDELLKDRHFSEAMWQAAQEIKAYLQAVGTRVSKVLELSIPLRDKTKPAPGFKPAVPVRETKEERPLPKPPLPPRETKEERPLPPIPVQKEELITSPSSLQEQLQAQREQLKKAPVLERQKTETVKTESIKGKEGLKPTVQEPKGEKQLSLMEQKMAERRELLQEEEGEETEAGFGPAAPEFSEGPSQALPEQSRQILDKPIKPTKQVVIKPAESGQSQGNLLEEIRKGKQLRETGFQEKQAIEKEKPQMKEAKKIVEGITELNAFELAKKRAEEAEKAKEEAEKQEEKEEPGKWD
jgi:hypothetical protein